MKTVFILGAGASVEAGAPTMADFLQKAKQLHSKKAYGAESQQIQDVIDAAYKDLKPVQVKSTINYRNIEDLFSAIDIGQLIQCFGSRPKAKIDELRRSIVVFIYRTIEETVHMPLTNGQLGLPKGYDRLAELVRKKIEKTATIGTTNEVSFITFNYDTCLEFALVKSSLGVDYGLNEPYLNDDEKTFHYNARVKVPVLKLHGSINWAMCPKCNAIVPITVDPYRRTNFIDLQFIKQAYGLPLSYGTKTGGANHHCGAALESLPFIVPPTWNKSSSSARGLQDVWKRAAKELGSAENIIVIGYSLPPTDMFFKYLFALGIDSDTHLERFIVINGANSESTRAQFEGLLGPITKECFQFYAFNFSGAIHIIEEALNQ